MKSFLDTSVLLKLYQHEDGSDELTEYLNRHIDEIILSELAILEFSSAVRRKVRMHALEEAIARQVLDLFQTDWDSLGWVKLGRNIVDTASRLLVRYGKAGLRSLDSIQSASALAVKDDGCVYFSSDKILKTPLRRVGLKLWPI